MKSSPTLPGKMHLWSTFILKKMQKFIEWSWHNNHNGQKHVCIAKRFVCMPQTYTYVFLLSPLYTWRKMILRKKRAVPPNHTKFTHVGLGCQTLVRLTSSWVLQFYLGTAFKSSPEFLSWVPPRSFHKSWCPGHIWHKSRKKLWVGTQAFTSFWSSPVSPHSSTLAWKIPWTEEPGRLQSMGSHRVRHDWATSLSLLTFMHWRRKWQPTPVFLPGESQGWGSLVGCRLWGRTESDMTEAT